MHCNANQCYPEILTADSVLAMLIRTPEKYDEVKTKDYNLRKTHSLTFPCM